MNSAAQIEVKHLNAMLHQLTSHSDMEYILGLGLSIKVFVDALCQFGCVIEATPQLGLNT